MANILMLHGNGGGKTRFLPFLKLVAGDTTHHFVVPALSGFDGRPLPAADNYWDTFLSDLEKALGDEEIWIVYGHGIGGSLVMEWAARDFVLPSGRRLQPQKILLHSVIGASLHVRFFPKLMKPMGIRRMMQRLIVAPFMRSIWKRRLFLQPEHIEPEILNRFFEDYAQCAAFPIFFDLITVDWYREVREKINQLPFQFVWGGKERVVQAKHLGLWKTDFPQSTFSVVEDWDHFPMLDDPMDFQEKFLNFIQG
ncbi:MAG: alpha/beta fold hydrolase [Bacteroidota bacterium]